MFVKKVLCLLICIITLSAHSSPETGELVLKIDLKLTLNSLPSMDHINDFSISLLQGVLGNMRRIIEPNRLSLAQRFFDPPRPIPGRMTRLTFVQEVTLTPPPNLIGEQIPELLSLHEPEIISLHIEMTLPIFATEAHAGYNPTISIPFFDAPQSVNVPLEQVHQLSNQLIIRFYQILNAHNFPLAVFVIYFLLALLNQMS